MQFQTDHIAIEADNLDVTKEFYKSLGGIVTSRPSERFVEMKIGDLKLHIVKNAKNAKVKDESLWDNPLDHFSLAIDSIKNLYSLCEKINSGAIFGVGPKYHGAPVSIIDSPPLGTSGHAEENPPSKTMYFFDPNGVQIEVRAYEQ